jgi:hypothetical protein
MRTSWVLLGVALLLFLAYQPVSSAPGSAGRDVLDSSSSFSFLENFGVNAAATADEDEDEGTHDHNSELNRLNHYFLDDMEETEEAEGTEESSRDDEDDDDENGVAEEASHSHESSSESSAGSLEQSAKASVSAQKKEEAPESAAIPSKAESAISAIPPHTSPYDDLVSIFSALGDKNAESSSRKILNSIPASESSATVQVRAKPRQKNVLPSNIAALQPSVSAAPVLNSRKLQDDTPPSRTDPGLVTPAPTAAPTAAPTDAPTAAPTAAPTLAPTAAPTNPPTPPTVDNSTTGSNTTNTTAPPIILRHNQQFVHAKRIIPIYDDAPAPNSTDSEIKAVQGSGGWKRAKNVPKDTLSACNKGDPCPPPTVPGQDPPPLTPLQQAKINADAEIQKKFDKPVVAPRGWVKPIHHDCGDNCAVVSSPDPTPPPGFDPNCPSGECKN